MMKKLLSSTSKHRRGLGQFVDKVRIYACGGTGGQGSSQVGGVGGDGGDVSVCAVEGSSLSDLARMESRRYIAGGGGSAKRSQFSGRKGNNVVISVPPGTVVYDQQEKEMLYDLVQCGMQKVLTKGGQGGSHMTPNWNGLKGQRDVFVLKLKSLADVGLVGLPNAGKSTLLAALSKATPKVADYPFTTLLPQIGTIAQNNRSLSIADIPGLVEGAHSNVGRGHKFLQHIERTKVLLYVVDITGFQLSSRHARVDSFESLQILVKELELYCPGLALGRKAVLVLNKMDLPHAQTELEHLLYQLQHNSPLHFSSIVGCSAQNKTGTHMIQKILFDLF